PTRSPPRARAAPTSTSRSRPTATAGSTACRTERAASRTTSAIRPAATRSPRTRNRISARSSPSAAGASSSSPSGSSSRASGRLEGGPRGPPFFLVPYNLPAVPQVAAAMRIAVNPPVLAALAVLASGPPARAQGLDADALLARAVALHQAGDTLGAIENYEAALEKDPGRLEARSNLGAAYAQLGRYTEAIENYQAVLQKRPELHPVRFNLALAFYKASRVPEAAAELERVVGQDPSNLRAVLLLADCRTQLGQDAGVVDLLAPREADFRDDRLYAYLLGNALLRRNEILRGQALIERLFKGGETPEARLLMGVAHLQREDYRAAVPELERAVALSEALPGAHSLLGRALMGAGRRDDAIKAF